MKVCDYLPSVRFAEQVYNGHADVNLVMLKEECFMLSTDTVSLSPNPLVAALGKPAKEFTKADIIGYIEDNGIRMLNLRYIGGDGRLKTLNFATQSKAHLDRVLTLGGRADAPPPRGRPPATRFRPAPARTAAFALRPMATRAGVTSRGPCWPPCPRAPGRRTSPRLTPGLRSPRRSCRTMRFLRRRPLRP